ncbi:MAG: glycosyltransferase family 4 protein [Patescibacteria group bacterium]
MKRRLLIFSAAYQPFVGGAEVAVKEITDRLTDYDFDLITVNLDQKQPAEEEIGSVSIYRLTGSKYFFPLAAYRLAAKLHQEKKYDAVWAIMANQAGMAAALFKRRFSSVPFLLTLQEGDNLNSLAYRLRLLAPRWFGVFRRADYLTAISNYLARWARQMGAQCPMTVIPNGVDLNNFQLLGSSFQDKKRNEKTIITTSRLVWKNGVDILIEAMQFLPSNARLQILGTGPEDRNLKLKAKSYHLEARVEFLGHVPPNEIPNYLAQADVFARPSRSEGLGNSFLEAMAVGVPVIGTPVGGIPDFLKDGETGWFCKVNNPKSVAEKVKYILDPNNREKVEQVITNAKKLVMEKYEWIKISQRMAQIIAKLTEI